MAARSPDSRWATVGKGSTAAAASASEPEAPSSASVSSRADPAANSPARPGSQTSTAGSASSRKYPTSAAV
jgi:hypothetical protein